MKKSWFSKTILDSGLTVLVVPMDSPSVTAIFMVKTGSKNEEPREAGVSHFLEHFVFKGTKHYPTTREVMRALDGLGAEHNAGTGKEYTQYWVKSSAAHLEPVLKVLADVVLRPIFPQDLLEKEKGTILQELAMYEDLPMFKVEENFEELLFGKGTGLGREIIGTRESLQAMTIQALKNYRARWYSPKRCVLVVAGGVREKLVVDLASTNFDVLPGATNESDLPSKRLLKLPADSTDLIVKKATDQLHLCVGVPAFGRRDSRRYTLGVLATIMGGNSSSQLFEEIREQRGLAYSVRAEAHRYEEGGSFVVHAGVPPVHAKEVRDLVLQKFLHFSFSPHELNLAKEYLRGHLALDWEDSQGVADHVAEDWLFEGATVRSREDIDQALARVTEVDVRKLASELFNTHAPRLVTAIGPVDLKFRSSIGNTGSTSSTGER